MLRTEDITKVNFSGTATTEVLNKINIAVEQGEFVAIMGPSGSGKTSLLNIIGLLDSPTSGKLWLNNILINSLSDKELNKLRKKHIGYVFQDFRLIPELNIYENIELPLLYSGMNSSIRREKVIRVMNELHLTQYEKTYPAQAPAHIQQKAGIARAVVIEPGVILADEPTGNLTSTDSELILNLLAEINTRGITIILTSHSKSVANKCNRIIQLLDGQIVTEGVRLAM